MTGAAEKNLYPLFARRWEGLPPDFEPLTRRVYQAFGLFPIPGDEHLCEYLPWASDPHTRPWEKYQLSLYDWDEWEALRDLGHQQIRRMAEGLEGVEGLLDSDSEGALEVIENIAGAGIHAHLAFNLPNKGQISNLPLGAIVETPGLVSGAGIQPLTVGALPEPMAELCRRELAVVRLSVDAAVHGDREAALQCLLLDPVITDLDVARQILEAYLQAYRRTSPPILGLALMGRDVDHIPVKIDLAGHFQEFLEVHRLDDIGIGAQLVGGLNIPVFGGGGQDDDRDFLCVG